MPDSTRWVQLIDILKTRLDLASLVKMLDLDLLRSSLIKIGNAKTYRKAY
jgi:hypothetical protein